MIKVLVINSGSSSIKYQLFDVKDGKVLASGAVERIGESESVQTHTIHHDADADSTVVRNTVSDPRRLVADRYGAARYSIGGRVLGTVRHRCILCGVRRP